MCASPVRSRAQRAEAPGGIDQRLGERVPLELRFVAENGDTVRLGQLVDRPTIVSLVYYTCPSVCRPLLEEVASMLAKLRAMEMRPGEDYRVLTISFDETDSPAGSARLKREYYQMLPAGFPREAWTFLTADAATIAAFTEAVGFHYRREGEDFAHPTTLIVLSAEGKITRYLFGAEYLPADIKLALIEASKGITGPAIARFLRFCFSYDPEGQRFVLNATRILGLSTLMGLTGFVVFLTASGRRRKKKVG
ncbi:MAG: SCO family protein [Candidatus Krumholzibacteria bacterium]|nr:SCO family protein [Candidatus Krumholzibacteria bacterium]